MKYIILFVTLFSFPLHAFTIECKPQNEPKERIYFDLNGDEKTIDNIYFNDAHADGFLTYFLEQGWDVSQILLGSIKNESRRLLQLDIKLSLPKIVSSIEAIGVPIDLQPTWGGIKEGFAKKREQGIINAPFANLIINKKDGYLFVYYHDNQTDLGQCFFNGENDFNYILS